MTKRKDSSESIWNVAWMHECVDNVSALCRKSVKREESWNIFRWSAFLLFTVFVGAGGRICWNNAKRLFRCVRGLLACFTLPGHVRHSSRNQYWNQIKSNKTNQINTKWDEMKIELNHCEMFLLTVWSCRGHWVERSAGHGADLQLASKIKLLQLRNHQRLLRKEFNKSWTRNDG